MKRGVKRGKNLPVLRVFFSEKLVLDLGLCPSFSSLALAQLKMSSELRNAELLELTCHQKLENHL